MQCFSNCGLGPLGGHSEVPEWGAGGGGGHARLVMRGYRWNISCGTEVATAGMLE